MEEDDALMNPQPIVHNSRAHVSQPILQLPISPIGPQFNQMNPQISFKNDPDEI